VKNIEITSLLILEFLSAWAGDLDCTWGCEVVRLCDEAGIKLDEHVRKQVSVSKKEIKDFRAEYTEKREASKYAEDEECDGDGYTAFALKGDWTPEDDVVVDEDEDTERLWYRWDWRLGYVIRYQLDGVMTKDQYSIKRLQRITQGAVIMTWLR
jgi:hypothetical protein